MNGCKCPAGSTSSRTWIIYFLCKILSLLGIDYHYRQEKIYASLSNGTIVSFNVNVTVGDIIDFTHTGTDVIYSGRGSVVTMAVEWVTDILYWVEFDGSNSQVCIMDSSLLCMHNQLLYSSRYTVKK